MRQYPFLDLAATKSFIIDLTDKVHYRYLTFSTLASNLLEAEEKTRQPTTRHPRTAKPTGFSKSNS
jgi:hypothetical protein